MTFIMIISIITIIALPHPPQLDHQLCMGVPPRRLLMALRVMVEDREGLGELEEMVRR